MLIVVEFVLNVSHPPVSVWVLRIILYHKVILYFRRLRLTYQCVWPSFLTLTATVLHCGVCVFNTRESRVERHVLYNVLFCLVTSIYSFKDRKDLTLPDVSSQRTLQVFRLMA